MILEKGGEGIEDTVLFGKYQLCRVIGTGRAGTVFLAVHLGLEEYRAVKRVPKSFLDYERFRREALILKELRHPGIPIVYDLEEDQKYSYLIEEYLEGESLYDLVRRQGYLPRRLVICYGIQLCRIVNYLHSAGTTPILHLDLQPKNLLLCHETVKLVDFDHAATVAEANAAGKRYGTMGCAAPEQYTDAPLNERTDIYAIGVILCYLSTGEYPGESSADERIPGRKLQKIVRSCLDPAPERRFSSAAEVCAQLERLQDLRTGVFTKQPISSLIIALAGSKPGAGVTHLAIGLSVYLNDHGYPNLCEEKNPSGTGIRLGAYAGAVRDRYGIMRWRGFMWKPCYGECVRLEESPYGIRILDCGVDWAGALEANPDFIILVCDSRVWSLQLCAEAVKSLKGGAPVCLVYNHTAGNMRTAPVSGVARRLCLKAPYWADPFLRTAKSDSFWKKVLYEMERCRAEAGRGGGFQRKGLGEAVKGICRRLTGR